MKTLTMLFLTATAALGQIQITNRTGFVYHAVEISRREADGLVAKTTTGVIKISFLELTPEDRDKYGYDSTEAQQHVAKTRQAQQKYLSMPPPTIQREAISVYDFIKIRRSVNANGAKRRPFELSLTVRNNTPEHQAVTVGWCGGQDKVTVLSGQTARVKITGDGDENFVTVNGEIRPIPPN